MYYIPRAAFEKCLREVLAALQPRAEFYLRMRLRDDYRYARGRESEPHGFILNTSETGEAGLLNVFYGEHELTNLIEDMWGILPQSLTILHCCFDNLQAGRLVKHNSDIVIWGALASGG
jgi:hypothetical protein